MFLTAAKRYRRDLAYKIVNHRSGCNTIINLLKEIFVDDWPARGMWFAQ